MRYRKKPIEINAIQFLGDDKNIKECMDFCPALMCQTYGLNKANNTFMIKTLEGNMTCSKGDWIVEGINGEFYPIKNDIFEKTYEVPA